MNSPVNVLFVGDADADAALLLHTLHKGPFVPVIEAVTTRRAFRNALQARDWDAIIANADLPRFSGKEALSIYRDSGKDTPFILIVADIDMATTIDFVAHGVQDVIERTNLDRLIPALIRELRSTKAWREHEYAERALRDSEAQVRAILDNSPSAIAIKDTKGRFTFVNKAFEKRHRFTAAAIIGKTTKDLFPKDFAAETAEFDRRVLKGERLVYTRDVTLDGDDRRTTLISRYPVPGPDGEIAAIGSIAMDITEQKQVEASLRQSRDDLEQRVADRTRELRENEAILRAIFDNSVAGIHLVDTDGRYILVNKEFERTFGIPADKLKGTLPSDHFPPAIADVMIAHTRTVVETAKPISFEANPPSANGNRHHLHVTKFPICDETGTVIQVCSFATDITPRDQTAMALRRSEERFMALINNAPASVCMMDRDGRFIAVNNEFIRRRGVESADSILGKTAFDFFARETAEEFAEQDRRVLQGGTLIEIEYAAPHPDGSIHSFFAIKFPVCGVDGEITNIGVFSNDITAIKRAETALRDSEARFRAVIDNSPTAISVKDVNGRLRLVNKEWERQYGLAAKVAEGKTLFDVMPPESAALLVAHDRQVIETLSPVEFEFETTGSDGLPQTDMVVKFPILGPGGKILAVGASHTNITERKRAEEALRWSEWDLRGILDNMVDTFFRTDREGRVIMVSPSVSDLAGVTPEDMLGCHFSEFFADPDTPTDLMTLLDGNGGKLDGYEVLLHHREGTELWALITARRYFDEDGDVAGIEGVAHDITVRKRAEQALKDSEDRFRDFAEASSDWMWEADVDNRFTYVSDRLTDLLGIPLDKIVGRKMEEVGDPVIHPADWKAHQETIAHRHPFRDLKVSLKDRDGGMLIVRVSGKPRFGGDGDFLGYRGTANDVTAVVTAAERETLIRRQFLDAIETVPVSFALFDAEDRLVLWNQRYQLHATPETKLMVGMTFEEIYRLVTDVRMDGDTDAAREEAVQQRLERHRNPSGPFIYQRETDWFQIREHRTPDGSTLLVVVDISDLRRVEDALREAQASLESLLSAAPVALWALDSEGRVTFSRGMDLAEPRSNPNDILGRHIADIYGGHAEIIEATNRALRGETVHATAFVGGRYFALRYQPLTKEDGTSRGCVGVAVDITERRQAEENLRKLSMAVEQSPAATLITDPAGIIEYANPRFYETTGFTSDEILGRTPAFLKPEDADSDQFEQMWETLRAGREWRGELRNRRKNGEIYWSSTAICPITNTSGEITHFLSVAEDTTEKRRMDEQLRHAQKLEAVGTLAGGVAHDFNNILTGIMGHSQIAIEKLPADSDIHFNLDQIMVASDRAKDLVQQLLAFSRRREAKLRPVSLHAITDEAIKLVHASIPSTITIRWSVPEDAATVLADPTQIHQVLLNLCSNAADAIGEAAGIIDVTVEDIVTTEPVGMAGYDLAPGRYARLSVSDSGCGMDSYTLARAFDPFFTTKPVGSGTGLGLAAVHGIVQDHGGGIEVGSEPGKGTKFSIYLPYARAETARDVKKVRTTEFSGTERILLVDDERMVLQSIGTYLEHFGYKVEALTSPAAALAIFQSMADQFDIVVTDQVMPNMTGDVLAGKLRELRPDIPIILCTGYAPPASARARKAVGIDEVVRKPIEPSELGHIIRRILDAKS